MTFSVFLRAAAAAVLVLPLLATAAHADTVVDRAAGGDRIQTAVEASENYRQTASDALLTTAFSYPDALAAGALAHRLDAPLLLTAADRLPQSVADELARLRVSTVWILGGEGAVSGEIEDALRALGFNTRRLAGSSRYETAREIAEAAGPSRTGEVVLALGEHGNPDRAWPDAVASGALAATPDRIPTVLTRPDALPEATEEALEDLQAREVIILGGSTAIAPAVEDRLIELGYATRRVAGGSRYDTSVALAEEALSRFGADSLPAVFASGNAFPDALSAGSLAASLGAPLMLVPPSSELPGVTEAFLRSHEARLSTGVMVGGPAAADDYVMAQLDAAIQGQPAPPRPAPLVAPQPAPQDEDDAPEESSEPAVLGTFSGVASWYGPGLEGNETANGETFDPSQLTAAHRTLPFNTIVRVTNLGNGRVVEVRINDRGPFSDHRVLDVSSAAADVLDMKHDGVADIRGDILSYG
ncbi:MAG TPA: septal ring lytic transglycosylase RlpA family protein [Euzebya sp.]|nr:septal ring lytic transglycosylase RlpA family protein [Euzebya sp.]